MKCPWKGEKFTGRHFVLAAIAGICLLAFSAGAAAYTSESNFCGSCHEMSPMYKSWAMSGHKNVACAECHEEPGVVGTVKAKAQGAKETYLHLTDNYTVPKASPEDINCYSCHQDKVKNEAAAADRKDPHTKKHFENGMNCLSCHSGVVHDEAKNTKLPDRENCFTCHLDQMNK